MRIPIPNLTNGLVAAGAILVGVGIFMPSTTASRAARVETRAEEAGRELLRVALEHEPLDLEDAATRTELESAFRSACSEISHPNSYLPDLRKKPEALAEVECALFDSKHYCFMLTRRPAYEQKPGDPPPARLLLEVYAWPQTLLPPGHTAFYFPEAGNPAFTRNLMHQYVGWDEDAQGRRKIPRPGHGHPRRSIRKRDYRGHDDERWIQFIAK